MEPNTISQRLKPMTLHETLHRYRYGTLDEVKDTHMADPLALEYDDAFAGLAVEIYVKHGKSKEGDNETYMCGPGRELIDAIIESWQSVIPNESIEGIDHMFSNKLFKTLNAMSEEQLTENAFPGKSRRIIPDAHNTLGRWERNPKLRRWSALERYVGKTYDRISLISEFGFLYDSDEEANFDINYKQEFMPIIASRLERKLLFRLNNTGNTANESITIIAINKEIPDNYDTTDAEVEVMCLSEWRYCFRKELRAKIVLTASVYVNAIIAVFNNALDTGKFDLARKYSSMMPTFNTLVGLAIAEPDFTFKKEIAKLGTVTKDIASLYKGRR